MSNRLSQLLSCWLPQKDEFEWVLATVIETNGSAYRKSGAMMLINSLGQWFGLLSGGCLENDLMRNAREVIQSNQSKVVVYDATQEDSLVWLAGIGCGGLVKIILQPINKTNHYLYLPRLLESINESRPCYYLQSLRLEKNPTNQLYIDKKSVFGDVPKNLIEKLNQSDESFLEIEQSEAYFISRIKPDPSLVIFGGGVDVKPMINIGNELGWRIYVVAHQPKQAHLKFLNKAYALLKIKPVDCSQESWLKQCDAAIVMNHNLELDADSLKSLKEQEHLKYIGLLGPKHRSSRVLSIAKIIEENLPAKLYTPIGFDIGGDLPESIALSALSQIHAVLENKKIN